ncbi:hypothetical protein Tco_0944185 [Tanacetum coccineum]
MQGEQMKSYSTYYSLPANTKNRTSLELPYAMYARVCGTGVYKARIGGGTEMELKKMIGAKRCDATISGSYDKMDLELFDRELEKKLKCNPILTLMATVSSTENLFNQDGVMTTNADEEIRRKNNKN